MARYSIANDFDGIKPDMARLLNGISGPPTSNISGDSLTINVYDQATVNALDIAVAAYQPQSIYVVPNVGSLVSYGYETVSSFMYNITATMNVFGRAYCVSGTYDTRVFDATHSVTLTSAVLSNNDDIEQSWGTISVAPGTRIDFQINSNGNVVGVGGMTTIVV